MSKLSDLQAVQQILARLVSFNTVSSNPNRALIDYVRSLLDGFGVASEIIAGEADGKACLWATIGEGDSGILLAGHTDVVPVTGQNWSSDPFLLTERNETLIGRGAADMKGFIACALAFIPEFLAAKPRGCFHLALTCDEETTMSGAMRLTDMLVARGFKPQWVWIGEPTGLSIVDQHKGVAVYRTRFSGIPHHSSQPDKGVSAIESAGDFMQLLREAAQKKKAHPFAPSRFDPPFTTFNLGKIEGGNAANIIAETCELLWEVRTHPGDAANEIMTDIGTQARDVAARGPLETCTCYDIPPFLATTHNLGTDTLKRLLKCDQTHAVGFATEGGIYQKLGVGAIVCGPGFIDQAHQPNEYIEKNQLTACVDLMRAVLLSSSARE